MPFPSHRLGDLCELILVEFLIRKNFYVYTPFLAQRGPVDVIGISEEGKVFLFDSKADSKRVNPGRRHPDRIYRKRSDLQKELGVIMAYVDEKTRNIYFTPEFNWR
jgi:hypothetical protein|tara:strand:+ start:16781 stop:17098 length:318 start_codon:yes stop_codon:yes gene_type:complete